MRMPVGGSKIVGRWAPPPWKGNMADLQYASHPPHHDNFSHVEPYERNYGYLTENFDHSKSPEQTRVDRLPMISYRSSVLQWSISYTISEINDDFCRNCKFFQPSVYLTPALRELPLEFPTDVSAQRTRVTFLLDGWKSLTIVCVHFDKYQSVTDRQTDRRICHNNIARCMRRHADALYIKPKKNKDT